MILATVGTHEQPQDRLFVELDRLVAAGEITEEVVAQVGHSEFTSPRLTIHRMLPYDQLQDALRAARRVITHGGPATIMQAFAVGKVPIVVPRQSAFGEHVDDHQVRFARRVADRCLVVLDIADLGPTLRDYEARVAALTGAPPGAGTAAEFARAFEVLCEDVLSGRRRRARRLWPW